MNTNELKQKFLLRDDITFLNFGSFGACPIPVFETYQNFQRELEQEPVDFFLVKGPQYLSASKAALANYIKCNAGDIVYVTNPSYGVNIIAKSLDLQPGDEVLTTNLEYGEKYNNCKKSEWITNKNHVFFNRYFYFYYTMTDDGYEKFERFKLIKIGLELILF